MALPLQIEPLPTTWAPRPVRLHLVSDVAVAESVYRRRRFMAAVLSVLAVAVGAFLVNLGVTVLGGSADLAPELRPATVENMPEAAGTLGGQVLTPGGVYVVQVGDTLWAVARALQPEGDLSRLVDQLVELNGGAELAVGDRVLLPA